MGDRGYSLIDFEVPDWIWENRNDVVRFLEYVRQNFHQILPAVPKECEVDIFAGGTAHSTGLSPLLGFWTPDQVINDVPNPFQLIEDVSGWCKRLSRDEIEMIIATTDAPTWAELQRIRVHPTRSM